MQEPPSLNYKGWILKVDDYEDSDGFWTDEYYAVKGDVQQHLHHSRFKFTPNLTRFAWLVDNNFPRHPKGWNWDNESIDKAIAESSSHGYYPA